jgi:hypothetical protein
LPREEKILWKNDSPGVHSKLFFRVNEGGLKTAAAFSDESRVQALDGSLFQKDA